MRLTTPHGGSAYAFKQVQIFRSTTGGATDWSLVRADAVEAGPAQCAELRNSSHVGWVEPTRFIKVVFRQLCAGDRFGIAEWSVSGCSVVSPPTRSPLVPKPWVNCADSEDAAWALFGTSCAAISGTRGSNCFAFSEAVRSVCPRSCDDPLCSLRKGDNDAAWRALFNGKSCQLSAKESPLNSCEAHPAGRLLCPGSCGDQPLGEWCLPTARDVCSYDCDAASAYALEALWPGSDNCASGSTELYQCRSKCKLFCREAPLIGPGSLKSWGYLACRPDRSTDIVLSTASRAFAPPVVLPSLLAVVLLMALSHLSHGRSMRPCSTAAAAPPPAVSPAATAASKGTCSRRSLNPFSVAAATSALEQRLGS